jgi:hypothetical protein
MVEVKSAETGETTTPVPVVGFVLGVVFMLFAGPWLLKGYLVYLDWVIGR